LLTILATSASITWLLEDGQQMELNLSQSLTKNSKTDVFQQPQSD